MERVLSKERVEQYKDLGFVSANDKVDLEALAISIVRKHDESWPLDSTAPQARTNLGRLAERLRQLEYQESLMEKKKLEEEALARRKRIVELNPSMKNAFDGKPLPVLRELEEERKIIEKSIRYQSGVLSTAQRRTRRTNELADEHARDGGDSLQPHLCVISFPGRKRGKLFYLLKEVIGLELGVDADVHVMNSKQVGQNAGKVRLPTEWVDQLENTEAWYGFQRVLSRKGYEPLCAPRWFVEHWGLAAWNVVRSNQRSGAGVILLQIWEGYTESDACRLELEFCKCLSERFGKRTCYVVNKAPHEDKPGFFLKGDEDDIDDSYARRRVSMQKEPVNCTLQ